MKMEWYGEKMLPRGLPELLHQVTPHWIARDLKVITCHRDPFDPMSRTPLGRVGWHDNWWVITLFPTKILGSYRNDSLGVPSFIYWLNFLEVALHEVGHIVTADRLVWRDDDRRYEEDNGYRRYIEDRADWWMETTKDTIATRDTRLGQSVGWIGGLPGLYLIRQGKMMMKYRSERSCSPRYHGIQDVRAYRCGGQLTLTNVLYNFAKKYLPISYYKVPRFIARLRRYVKKEAPKIGITRHYIDTAGRKHLFFNNGEAKAMVDHLREHVSKGDLIEVAVKESTRYDRALQETMNRLIGGPEMSIPQAPIFGNGEMPF
jgi:hypothetical protein